MLNAAHLVTHHSLMCTPAAAHVMPWRMSFTHTTVCTRDRDAHVIGMPTRCGRALLARVCCVVKESSAASHRCHFRVRHFGRLFTLPYKRSCVVALRCQLRLDISSLLGLSPCHRKRSRRSSTWMVSTVFSISHHGSWSLGLAWSQTPSVTRSSSRRMAALWQHR